MTSRRGADDRSGQKHPTREQIAADIAAGKQFSFEELRGVPDKILKPVLAALVQELGKRALADLRQVRELRELPESHPVSLSSLERAFNFEQHRYQCPTTASDTSVLEAIVRRMVAAVRNRVTDWSGRSPHLLGHNNRVLEPMLQVVATRLQGDGKESFLGTLQRLALSLRARDRAHSRKVAEFLELSLGDGEVANSLTAPGKSRHDKLSTPVPKEQPAGPDTWALPTTGQPLVLGEDEDGWDQHSVPGNDLFIDGEDDRVSGEPKPSSS